MANDHAATGFSRGFFGCFGVLAAIVAVGAVLFALFVLSVRHSAQPTAAATSAAAPALLDAVQACTWAAEDAHADFKVGRLTSDGPQPGYGQPLVGKVGGVRCAAHDTRGAVSIDATANCLAAAQRGCLGVIGVWRGSRLLPPR